MIFADKLTALRKQQGWSQEELAEKTGVSRQSVSKWESAQSMPDLQKILQLSELFGVSTDYLLKDYIDATGQSIEPVHKPVPPAHRISAHEAEEFLALRSSASRRIALGVLLCILSPVGIFAMLAAAFIPGSVIKDSASATGGPAGLIILFLLVAAAVAIFITTGTKSSQFAFLENEAFELEAGLADTLRMRQTELRPGYTRSNAIGVCLCILSPIPLLAGAFTYNEALILLALCVTLLIAGVGVVFLVAAGVKWAAFEKLLKEGDYSPKNLEAEKLKSSIAGIYWLALTAGYLIWSFAGSAWDKSWIVWPAAGVVFAAVMVICDIAVKRKDK